jgi:hypothetical protein
MRSVVIRLHPGGLGHLTKVKTAPVAEVDLNELLPEILVRQ